MTIEWGDCDDAGIVFYPNYFRWFDNAFHHLLRQCGIGQRILVERFDIGYIQSLTVLALRSVWPMVRRSTLP